MVSPAIATGLELSAPYHLSTARSFNHSTQAKTFYFSRNLFRHYFHTCYEPATLNTSQTRSKRSFSIKIFWKPRPPRNLQRSQLADLNRFVSRWSLRLSLAIIKEGTRLDSSLSHVQASLSTSVKMTASLCIFTVDKKWALFSSSLLYRAFVDSLAGHRVVEGGRDPLRLELHRVVGGRLAAEDHVSQLFPELLAEGAVDEQVDGRV